MAALRTALQVEVTEDLLPLSALLHQRGIAHRVFEEGGQQVLKVDSVERVQEVQALYQAWRSDELRIELSRRTDRPSLLSGARIRGAPITLVLIVLSLCGFALVQLDTNLTWVSLLSFTPFGVSEGRFFFQLQSGEYWRYFTPVFLHFGWLHITFNCMWLWELGSRMERQMSSIDLLMLFMAVALLSNTAQFVYGGAALFGGMSGVVYGFLGFSWVGARLNPNWSFEPPKPIMLFMLGWLVLCMVGATEALGFGAIANAAHAGGLVSGALLGAAFGLLGRSGGDKP